MAAQHAGQDFGLQQLFTVGAHGARGPKDCNGEIVNVLGSGENYIYHIQVKYT